MKKFLLIWIGKIFLFFSKTFNLGAGSTWPGHIAFEIKPEIFLELVGQLTQGVILVAGTNGKTTTAKILGEILTKFEIKSSKLKIIRNESGANLLNGMVSSLIKASNWRGKINADWAIFETDEATLPLVIDAFRHAEFSSASERILNQVQDDDKSLKLIVVLLNLFRDQLDRYGEVDLIADKWLRSLRDFRFLKETAIIINADDPQLAWIGKNLKSNVKYFGLEDKNLFLPGRQHAADSTYCPQCGIKLFYKGAFFSHLGIWKCENCGLKRPKLDLSNWSDLPNLKGVYNRYNILAAVLTAKTCGINKKNIKNGSANFQPAFGRQEEIMVEDRKIRMLLSKNPAGFNESLRTLFEFPGKNKTILLVLNDRVPDGKDVSWIWDVDYEEIGGLEEIGEILISGDRAYDMGLRIKYARQQWDKATMEQGRIYQNLKEAIKDGLARIKTGETLYILATYSGMLEARKIIGGKKLL